LLHKNAVKTENLDRKDNSTEILIQVTKNQH